MLTMNMNIKINAEEREQLLKRESIYEQFVFGSRLYGTHTEQSDSDILRFYIDFSNCNLPHNHCFQYDDLENNVQEVWVGLRQFWHLFHKGDNTIFIDYVLFGGAILATDDTQRLAYCRTYNTIKCVLGYVKRDIKKGTVKRLNHAKRGLYIAECLLDNYLPVLENIKNIQNEEVDAANLTVRYQWLKIKMVKQFENNKLKIFYEPDVKDTLHQKLLVANNIKEFKY